MGLGSLFFTLLATYVVNPHNFEAREQYEEDNIKLNLFGEETANKLPSFF